MKFRWGVVAGQVLLASIIGCGREPDKGSEIPPPPESKDAVAPDSAGYQVMQVSDGGIIAGTITVSGSIPKLPPRPLNKDPNVCGTGVRESQQLILNKGALKNAVVIVENVKRGKPMTTGQSPQIDQSKCEYTPHVQVVSANAEIGIVNSDPVLHNIHFYQNDDSLFNIAQPVKGQVNKYKVEKTGFV